MMKFNSNKLNERIDFCEDVSERVNGNPMKPKTKYYTLVSLAFKNLKNPKSQRIS